MCVLGGMRRAIIGAPSTSGSADVSTGNTLVNDCADDGAVCSIAFLISRAGSFERKSTRSARKIHVRRPALTERNWPVLSQIFSCAREVGITRRAPSTE